MEFLGIPIFDDDLYKMLFRFGINLASLTIIIRFLYYKSSRNTEYLFTYYMISIIVFFLCFTLKKYELDLGMALGLFAIFGIIRYRTNPIEIKEMTYLFVVIGVSVINSLANRKVSYSEIILANSAIIFSITILEYVWLSKKEKLLSKKIIYDNLELIKPDNHLELKADLEMRTGIIIERVKVGAVNFPASSANVTIHYKDEIGDH